MQVLRVTNQVLGRVTPGFIGERARRLFMRPRRGTARTPHAMARGLLPSGLVFWRAGPSVARARVVMLHGWESRAAHLSKLIEPLLAGGLEVVALDAPAHGDSPGLEAHPVAFADALREAGRVLGPFDAVIGHSMGGGAALLAIAEGLDVKRAVTIGAPASVGGVLHRFANYVGLPSRAESAFRRAVVGAVGRPVEEVSVDVIAAGIAQPVLLVHDVDDVEVPFSEATALERLLPNATLFSTRGLGHRRVIRDAAVAEKVAQFVMTGLKPSIEP
jgi:pimeloyl-ACP methyl ester carboxylesterase